MSVAVEYLTNKASVAEIADHLLRCDTDFVPPLVGRVEIIDYAKKIANMAMRFEAWAGGTLIGLVAAYCNHQESRIAYITSVSVLRAWMGKGIAARLMGVCIEYAKASGMQQIGLEVTVQNAPAIKLYAKSGFVIGKEKMPFVTMNLCLKSREEHEP